MKIHIRHDGDTSVGIDGDEATLEINTDGWSEEDAKTFIDDVKESMKETFTELWGFRAYALTEDELKIEEPNDY